MANSFSKRLARIEELLAARINQPLATVWREPGETREQACERAGYDPAYIDRIRFVSWLAPDQADQALRFDDVEAGPPVEPVDERLAANSAANSTDLAETGAPIAPIAAAVGLDAVVLDPDADDPDRRAERRLQTAKLREADRAFGRTIA